MFTPMRDINQKKISEIQGVRYRSYAFLGDSSKVWAEILGHTGQLLLGYRMNCYLFTTNRV